MKISKYSLVAGVFYALLFCDIKSSKAQVFSPDKNGEAIELVGQPKAFSSGEVFLPGFLNTFGDLIIIQDDADSMVYKVFNRHTLEFIVSFGKKGMGPNEISFGPTAVHQDIENTESFEFYDFGKKRLIKLSLENILANDIANFSQYVVFPPELINAQLAIFLDEDHVVGSGGIREGKLFFYNTNTESIKYTDFIPKTKKPLPTDRDRGYLYSNKMTVNREAKRIAVVNEYFKQLEIYNYEGALVKTYSFPDTEEPIFYLRESITSDETVLHYNGICSTKDFIYASYIGFDDIELEKLNYDIPTEIHVFTWEGSLHKIIKLDRPIKALTVTEDNKTLIAVDPLNEDMPLVMYNIKP
ncbi:TolB-like protein [Roseivirga ehrenbergii]|uniref:6-bladed beta-propeller n=1 Tax=Roseivirga ehrenbergii (strain DSM 102268 / JCM 13514 / KCTC 12282 / NCIMB 14502 / KMM 6017) TaxID=279360 RepID=A0A150XLI6_ROSEK|nr:BF3164 family lipoprotein [Roseivirga ehrenbergii]KYG79571.1 hypothetical protein MB14_17060 [Roseivirga ehrenbergii]TCL01045.1 TolB-like protein [Roseivirga ehrenbergii]